MRVGGDQVLDFSLELDADFLFNLHIEIDGDGLCRRLHAHGWRACSSNSDKAWGQNGGFFHVHSSHGHSLYSIVPEPDLNRYLLTGQTGCHP